MALISAFLDTSGLFAILAKPDPAHLSAIEWLARARAAKASAVTTDKHFRKAGFTPLLPVI